MSFIPYFDKSKAVEIELDKKRLLYFTIGDSAELESNLGVSMYQISANPMRWISSQQFVQEAFFIGLQADERGITKERVQEIIADVLLGTDGMEEHANALMGMSSKIMEALQNCGAMPKAKKEDKEKGKPKAEKAGKE